MERPVSNYSEFVTDVKEIRTNCLDSSSLTKNREE